MKIRNLKVKGYKCLKDIDLEIRDLMVLIGPNGAGKTALLEIFTLLRDAARGNLNQAILERGGISDVFFRGGAEELYIHLITMNIGKHIKSLKYILNIRQKEIGYEIFREGIAKHLINGSKKSYSGKIGEETTLSKFKTKDEEAEELRFTFAQMNFYSNLDVVRRAPVRLPQELSLIKIPSANGENLISALYNMRSNNPDAYERLEEALSVAFPGFKRLDFPLVGAGQATIAWYEKSFDKPLFQNQLSEGMLRFLWLATILLCPNLPPIILIDEPEVSLHPDSLKILAGLMEEASIRSQIIVATHSDVLLRYLKPENVVVVNRDPDDGSSSFRYGDTFNLDKWIEKYTLGELWLMRALE
ncbi:MAG: AAA family ATPase [bacterium]